MSDAGERAFGIYYAHFGKENNHSRKMQCMRRMLPSNHRNFLAALFNVLFLESSPTLSPLLMRDLAEFHESIWPEQAGLAKFGRETLPKDESFFEQKGQRDITARLMKDALTHYFSDGWDFLPEFVPVPGPS